MQKFRSNTITGALVLFGLVGPIFAQLDISPPANVVLDSVAGNQMALPLTLSNPDSQAIDAFGLTLIYPTNLLTFQNTDESGTLTDGWISVSGQENTPGKVIIGGFHTDPTTASGVLLNIIFEINGEAGQDTLKLTRFIDDIADAGTTPAIISYMVTSVESMIGVVDDFFLSQNYPNPFNPETRIGFSIPATLGKTAQVNLSVFNASGQLVRKLLNESHTPGSYEIQWDGRSDNGVVVPSGIYVYTIRIGEQRISRKMLLIR